MSSNPDDLTTDQQPEGQQQPTPIEQVPPEELRKQLQLTRTEAARYRVKNRDLSKMIGTLTGEEVPEGSQPPDLATLKQRMDKRDGDRKSEVHTLRLDLGLERASRKHGVERPSVLKAFLTDAGTLASLDPLAATFEDDLSVIVEEAIENAPELRGRPGGDVPHTTGARFSAPAPSQQVTRSSLAGMTPTEVAESLRSGALDGILGRRGF
jgi:hypothetical protein